MSHSGQQGPQLLSLAPEVQDVDGPQIWVREQIFEFRARLFGISLALRTFTRCVHTALAPMRLWGLRILDDRLVCASSIEQCRSHVALLVSHVQALGLRLNPKKCWLEPPQSTTFLGMYLDSVRGLVSLTAER